MAKYLPSGADLCAGSGIADHARYAIKQLSFTTQQRRIFAHVGWRQIDGQWVYLHSNGAIGKFGDIEGVEAQLPPELSYFDLVLPINDVKPVRSSLKLLDLGSDRITVVSYGAIWRSILGGADFSIFLYGRTGVFKTELAALMQQHFGDSTLATYRQASRRLQT